MWQDQSAGGAFRTCVGLSHAQGELLAQQSCQCMCGAITDPAAG